jgi:hypothetical protein
MNNLLMDILAVLLIALTFTILYGAVLSLWGCW